MSKRIGILGSGQVARALSKGFLELGYDVMLSSRNTDKLKDWKNEAGGHAHLGTFIEAAAYGDILVLAIKGSAAVEALSKVNKGDLQDKTIIDTTNPISSKSPEHGVIQYSTDLGHSLMEELQGTFPDALFVKAFNSVGNQHMVNPSFPDGPPTMFICGNSDKAKSEASEIIRAFGWQIEDMGKVEAARAIEPLCMLWCIPGMLHNQWNHAFKLIRK